MLRITVVAGLLGAFALAACSPEFNWRELRVPDTPLKALLPCKPDQASRPVELAGRSVQLAVLGCDAGGATFAVMSADLGDAASGGPALAQWKRATLLNLRAAADDEKPFLPSGGVALREAALVAASGQRADGSPVQSRAAYFARGSRVYQAVIYADRIEAAAADAFFSGLKFE